MNTLPQPAKRRKLLILKLLAIGDVAITCGSLARLDRDVLGQFDIYWLIDKRLVGLAKSLSDDLPSIHWVSIDSSDVFSSSIKTRLEGIYKLFSAIRGIAPDAIAILHRDRRYRWLSQMAAPMGTMIRCMDQMRGSDGDRQLAVFLALGLVLAKKQVLSEGRHKMADHNGTRRVIISVGGGKNQKTSFPEKKWPHFEQLARIIVTRSNWHICFIGGDDDVEETQAIISKLPESRDRITNQVGKLDLSQLPNFIKDYDAVVSVDTGIAHIASCVFEENHQRIFTLFGPTDANSWAAQQPKGGRTIVISSQQDCSPCYLDDGHYKSCPFDGEENKKCMKLISAEHVFTIMRLELT